MITFGRPEEFIVDDRPRVPQVERPRYVRDCNLMEPDYEPSIKSSQPHPIVNGIGIFSDDPLWDEFVEEMAKARREQEQAYTETE